MYNLLFTVLSAYEMQYISKYVLLYYDFRKIFKKKEPKKIVHDLFLYSVNMHWCNSKLITYFGILRFLRSFCYLNGKYEIFIVCRGSCFDCANSYKYTSINSKSVYFHIYLFCAFYVVYVVVVYCRKKKNNKKK